MENWVQDLIAFVWNNPNYAYGTKSYMEFKVMTPEATIEVQSDERWQELAYLGDIISGKS